jgi:nitrate reductase beta subunit
LQAGRWFQDALKLRSGDDYVAGDISVRESGNASGKPLGVLAIHFDRETQARTIVEGVRVDDDKARVLLVDSKFRVIASSDGQGLLTEHVPLAQKGGKSGVYKDTSGLQVAFHLTPGYETYKGLGWFGVIVR